MKKHVTMLSILLCLFLCACSIDNTAEISNSQFQDIKNNPTPPTTLYPLDYDSLEDLKNSVSKNGGKKIYDEFTKEGAQSNQLNSVKFFVDEFRSQNIIVPHLNGKVIDFRNREEYANISLFASEAYGLPWVFYYPKVPTGENFYIKMTYLPDNVNDGQNDAPAADVIKKLSSNSPNINNLGEQHEKIYNQNIQLKDREVIALIIEYKNDSRSSTIFVYDNLLIEVRSNPAVWSEEWFSTLSFDSFT